MQPLHICLLFVALISGCDTIFGPRVSVPELDLFELPLDRIRYTKNQEEVRLLLGEPAIVTNKSIMARNSSEVIWWYAIRTPSGSKSRAAILKIHLDENGRLEDWGFFHPITGNRMEIRETIERAKLYISHLCRPPNPPEGVELATVLTEGRAKKELVKSLTDQSVYYDVLRGGVVRVTEDLVRVTKEEGKETLIFYVDRPSPLYISAKYLKLAFSLSGDRLGRLDSWEWHFVGPGCL